MEESPDHTDKTMRWGEQHSEYHVGAAKSRRRRLLLALLYSLSFGLVLVGTFLTKTSVSIVNRHFHNLPSLTVNHDIPTKQSEQKQCPQVAKISHSRSPELIIMDDFMKTKEYQQYSAGLLSAAISYKTVSYDEMGDDDFPLDDPLFDPFTEFFHNFTSVKFPNVNELLDLEHISKHALLYTWEGTYPDLKPTVLLAHLDVVPVEEATIDEWDYDPWGGEVAHGRVWGRGAFDTKHTLVAILESIEALLQAGFQPKRTVLLSFNFDEELGGPRGAKSIVERINQRYPDGAAVVIDEGSAQFEQWGADMVMIGLTEKLRMTLNIEIRTPGGHSSQPLGPHTGIGIMSEIVVAIENLTYPTYLSDGHPLLDFLVCAQQHAPEFPDVLNSLLDDRLAGKVPPPEKDELAVKFAENAGWLESAVFWSMTTAKSVNVIQGGSKSNSLPEQTITLSDFRIHLGESILSTRKDLSAIIGPIARKHRLRFIDFDEPATETDTWIGSIRVREDGLDEPAIISPSKVIPGTDTPWSIVAGTTRSVLGEGITVVPGMTPGNTDARWYSHGGVSDYVYRYSPGATIEDSFNMHTVNENMDVKRHVNGARWYSAFIRNMDAAVFEWEYIEGE